MKLIYIANIRIPTEKAHGIQIMKMCEAFASVGNEVELIVPRRINSIKANPFEYYEVKKIFKIKRIPCVDFISSGIGSFFILESLSFLFFSKIYLFFKKYDLVYTRDVFAGNFLNNFVLELHSLPKTINKTSKKIFKKARGIIVLTSFIKKELVDIGMPQEKVLVSPDAVDLSQFDIKESAEELREKYNLPQDKKIITYAGKFKTMGQSKGVEDIIEAFQNLSESLENSFMLIVGVNSEEIGEIEKIFDELKINKNYYKIVDHISQKELFKYLKASDVLVMNYPNTKHYAYYMSPLKLFEYMASGKPIVSSDLPSIREILNEDNAILVKPEDSEGLARGLEKILNDQILTQKISSQAFKDVQNHTWQKRAEKIISFFSK